MKKLFLLLGIVFFISGCTTVTESLSNINCSISLDDTNCTKSQILEKYKNDKAKRDKAIESYNLRNGIKTAKTVKNKKTTVKPTSTTVTTENKITVTETQTEIKNAQNDEKEANKALLNQLDDL